MVELIEMTDGGCSSSANVIASPCIITNTNTNTSPTAAIATHKASAHKSLSKKSSSKNLHRDTIASPTGARPKLSRSATLAAHPLPNIKHRQTLPPPPKYTPTPSSSSTTTTTTKTNHTNAPARTGHARGGPALTLRIDSTLAIHRPSEGEGGSRGARGGAYHALRSAPARSVRRLPAVPGVGGRGSPSEMRGGAGAAGAPLDSESAAALPPMPFTPYTAPVGGSQSQSQSQFAAGMERREGRGSVRPLPSLPRLETLPAVLPLPETRPGENRGEEEEGEEGLNTVTPTATSSRSRSGSVTPTTKIKPTGVALTHAHTHTRSKSVRKPLPVPVGRPKVEEGDEAFLLGQLVAAMASSSSRQPEPTLPEIELPVQQSNTSDVLESQEVVLQHQRDRESSTPELDADTDAAVDVDGDWDDDDEGMNLDDLEEGVIQLGNRIVLRKISNVSLDSDFTSSEDEEELKPLPPLKEKDTNRHDENRQSGDEEYIDYSWVLSNRMLYKQCGDAGQTGVVSKWMLERKGKRYTEQDYENIISALRTL